MGGADTLERFADDGLGECGAVAVAAEVAEVEVPEFRCHDFAGERGCRVVGEVAMPAEDALFGGPRAAGVVLQHLYIVIGFEHEDMGGAHAFDDEVGGMAEIGEEADVPRGGAQEEADGIVGVVRHAESVDREVAEIKGGTGGEESVVERALELSLDGFFGETIAVNGDAQAAGEHAEALSVVGVFVSDENAI